MRYLRCLGLIAPLLFIVFVASAGATTNGSTINFTSLNASQPYHVSGTLYMPQNTSGPCPAIVMVHGTTGIGVVNALYREPILNAGIAIFEVDFKTGIYHGPMDRPRLDTFLPLAFAALKELRKSPGIDPNRIGIMGFSMGGGVVLRTAVESYRQEWMGNEKGFATFVAFYPVTKAFMPVLELSGSTLMGPMIIFYGTNDSYGEGTAVPEFKKLLEDKYHYDLTTVEYAGATHDFNRNEPARSYPDPAAIGGKGYMEWNPAAANDSLTKVVAFLRQTLEVK
jgi:uncharacterized protein